MPLARLLAMRETRPLEFAPRVLAAETAIVLVAGQDVILTKTAAPVTLTADVGVVEVAGQAASLRKTAHVLQTEAAVVEVEGQDATLALVQPGTTTMVAEVAVVEVAGQDAELTRSITLAADMATVEVAGQDATLRKTAHVLAADVATVEVAGQDAALTRSITLTADAGTIEVAGQDATLTVLPPQIAAFETAATGGGQNSIVIDKPAGTVEGDLLVIFVNAAGAGFTAITSTGFDQLVANVINGAQSSAQLLSKVAGGSEPSTYTINLAGGTSSIEAIALRIPGGTIEASDVNMNNSAGTTAAFDSVASAARSLAVQFLGTDSAQLEAAGEPSGYALLTSIVSNNDNGEASCAWKSDPDAVVGPGTWALDASDESICVALAIKGRPAFALGAESFTDQNARSNTWTSADHTVAAADNLVIVALIHEDNLTASAVALDPNGENIALSRIVRDSGSATNSVVDIWGAYSASGLGLSGSVPVVATIPGGSGAAGAMAVWTFSGAGRLPTTGDFASDENASSGTSLAVNLDVAAGDIMLAASCVNGDQSVAAANITKVHENLNAIGGQGDAFMRGTASDPSITYGISTRGVLVAVKITPA